MKTMKNKLVSKYINRTLEFPGSLLHTRLCFWRISGCTLENQVLKWMWKLLFSALSTKTEAAAGAEVSFTAVIPSWCLWYLIEKFLGIPLCFSGEKTTLRRREVGCFCWKMSSIINFDSTEFLGTPQYPAGHHCVLEFE